MDSLSTSAALIQLTQKLNEKNCDLDSLGYNDQVFPWKKKAGIVKKFRAVIPSDSQLFNAASGPARKTKKKKKRTVTEPISTRSHCKTHTSMSRLREEDGHARLAASRQAVIREQEYLRPKSAPNGRTVDLSVIDIQDGVEFAYNYNGKLVPKSSIKVLELKPAAKLDAYVEINSGAVFTGEILNKTAGYLENKFEIAAKEKVSHCRWRPQILPSTTYCIGRTKSNSLKDDHAVLPESAVIHWEEYHGLTVNDVAITIEYCSECAGHDATLWHKESQYLQQAQQIRLELANCLAKFAIRCSIYLKPISIWSIKNPATGVPDMAVPTDVIYDIDCSCRIGALEVQICVHTAKGNTVEILHSKLFRGTWPSVENVTNLAVHLCEDLGINDLMHRVSISDNQLVNGEIFDARPNKISTSRKPSNSVHLTPEHGNRTLSTYMKMLHMYKPAVPLNDLRRMSVMSDHRGLRKSSGPYVDIVEEVPGTSYSHHSHSSSHNDLRGGKKMSMRWGKPQISVSLTALTEEEHIYDKEISPHPKRDMVIREYSASKTTMAADDNDTVATVDSSIRSVRCSSADRSEITSAHHEVSVAIKPLMNVSGADGQNISNTTATLLADEEHVNVSAIVMKTTPLPENNGPKQTSVIENQKLPLESIVPANPAVDPVVSINTNPVVIESKSIDSSIKPVAKNTNPVVIESKSIDSSIKPVAIEKGKSDPFIELEEKKKAERHAKAMLLVQEMEQDGMAEKAPYVGKKKAVSRENTFPSEKEGGHSSRSVSRKTSKEDAALPVVTNDLHLIQRDTLEPLEGDSKNDNNMYDEDFDDTPTRSLNTSVRLEDGTLSEFLYDNDDVSPLRGMGTKTPSRRLTRQDSDTDNSNFESKLNDFMAHGKG